MDTEDSNSTPQTERDKLNDQLDELRQNQQERKPQKKTRPHWKRRLLGFLGVISSLFLLGKLIITGFILLRNYQCFVSSSESCVENLYIVIVNPFLKESVAESFILKKI